MLYRKRPVVVEAVEMTENMLSCDEYSTLSLFPVGIKLTPAVIRKDNGCPFWCMSLEGPSYGHVGDFFIRGVKGEPYFCRRDIFLETYEPAS